MWKPNHAMKTKDAGEEKHDVTKTKQELVKTVRRILNKVTQFTFDKYIQRIKNLDINTEEQLALIIDLFHEKAVKEPLFSTTYAKMCQALSSKEVPCSDNLQETVNFRKLLLTKSEREFKLGSAGFMDVKEKKKEIEENQNEFKEQERKDELEILAADYRKRFSGNIRFLGELFNLKIVSTKVIHQCLARLFNQPDDESSFEQICVLLTTSGKALELQVPSDSANALLHSSQEKQMDSYIFRLATIVNEHDISTEIRFKIKDVIYLRKNRWNPRHEEDNCPQTPDQIHKVAIRERLEQEREWNSKIYLEPVAGRSREMPTAREPFKDILQREDNASVEPSATIVSTSVYDVFQRNLEYFLEGSKRSIQEVNNWIKNQPVETDNPLFIRVLSTAVMEISLNGSGSGSKLNTALFNDYSELLRDYVGHVVERELQLLFAVQKLYTQRQYPKGLQEIFEILYNWNVVSDEGFESWVTNEEPSEREGKAAALKSSASFIIWLKEADSE